MKDIIAFSLTLLGVTLLLSFKIALAEERVWVDELAESGINTEFQMAAEEIAGEEEENTRLVAPNADDSNNPQKLVEIVETGESGQAIEFRVKPTDTVVASDDLSTDRNR
jgi:hypothetical protein